MVWCDWWDSRRDAWKRAAKRWRGLLETAKGDMVEQHANAYKWKAMSKKLRKENAELLAEVERLRKALLSLHDPFENRGDTSWIPGFVEKGK